MTVFAGIGERPGATILLNRSTPSSGSDANPGKRQLFRGRRFGHRLSCQSGRLKSRRRENRSILQYWKQTTESRKLRAETTDTGHISDPCRQMPECFAPDPAGTDHNRCRNLRARPFSALPPRQRLDAARSFVRVKFRIVIPAQSEIERQVVGYLPIVLHEQRGVIISQMNLVACRCESSGVGDRWGRQRRRQRTRSRPPSQKAGLALSRASTPSATVRRKFNPNFRSWSPKSLLRLALNEVYC